jgi:uroporphyrinogen-III decarboxylase
MTPLERWRRTLHFGSPDHVPDYEFGYWDETLTRWHAEGLPPQVDTNEKADRYFGFDPTTHVPVDLGLIPPFKDEIVEETDEYRVVRDGTGVLSVQRKDGRSTIPKYLEFPLKTREDWADFKRRLDPKTPGRVGADIAQRRGSWRDRDIPLGVSIGSLFGWVRNWMGFEGVAVACVDDPEWIDEIIEHITVLVTDVLGRALEGVELDFGAGWEDMCYRSGPIISPAMFSEFMVARYKRITDLLKRHGADVVIVDCDGNIEQLVPLWLEGGVNAMFPVEVGAGTDPAVLRSKYGREVLLLGGVDKRALIAGKPSIDAEVAKVAKLAEQGGFIPHVDHRVPADVSYENYLYYLRKKREALGIPQKEPGESWTA